MNATQNLKNDHITIRRVKEIAQKCSNRLYTNQNVPIEDIEIISVIIEEFVDHFHHGKEEKAYFPDTKDKNGFAEEVRKFLIEHEFARRIAIMLRRELNEWKSKIKDASQEIDKHHTTTTEPVARFLRTYAIFIDDHTGKEDKFFDLVNERNVISDKENEMLLKHYEMCKNQAGGEARMQEMIILIEYLEEREWMKDEG
jgi:hemerythrin-like domain-containing protein